MRKVIFLLLSFLLLCCGLVVEAQKVETSKPQKQNDAATEKEIKEFFDSYAEDLRSARREAIANRYDSRGYYRLGNGGKRLVSFADSKDRYLNRWIPPKSFEWKNLSIEVLSPKTAVVVGQFDWQAASGDKWTASYSGLLLKDSGKWRIRVEDESFSPEEYSIQPISGDRNKPGNVKYTLRCLFSKWTENNAKDYKIKQMLNSLFSLILRYIRNNENI